MKGDQLWGPDAHYSILVVVSAHSRSCGHTRRRVPSGGRQWPDARAAGLSCVQLRLQLRQPYTHASARDTVGQITSPEPFNAMRESRGYNHTRPPESRDPDLARAPPARLRLHVVLNGIPGYLRLRSETDERLCDSSDDPFKILARFFVRWIDEGETRAAPAVAARCEDGPNPSPVSTRMRGYRLPPVLARAPLRA